MESQLVQGYECLSSCLGYYINQSFPAISGSEICLYGGAFFVSFDEQSHVFSTPIYESNFVFLEKNGIPYKHGFVNDNDPDGFVSKSLAAGENLIFKVSADCLMYDRVFRQADNSTHYICITGEDENNYHVVDCYVPSRIPSCFSGSVSKSEILSAWEGKGYEYILLGTPDLNSDQVLCCIKKNIKRSIGTYCGLVEHTSDCRGEKEIFKLLDYIAKIMDEPDFRNATLYINYQLKIYGFISTKIMLSQFLKRRGICSNVCEEYDSLIAKWQSVCMHVVKLGITRKESQYEKIQTMVQSLVEEEHQILTSIYEFLTH